MFPDRMSGLSNWIRSNCRSAKDGLSVVNIDYVIRRWDTKQFMVVEEKMFDGLLPYSQSQALRQLDSIFRQFGGGGEWSYVGFFLVRLSNKSPDDSDVIRINESVVTLDQLKEHLSIESLHAKPIESAAEWKSITKH